MDRLSALDAAFVSLDRLGTPYVVGSVMVFDRDQAGPPVTLEHVRSFVGAAVDRLPAYRRRIGRVPLLRHPVWLDDRAFDIEHHVQRIPVPAPGTDDQLWDLAGRLIADDLPPEHPPWRLWYVDQLTGGRFALISAVHHCLLDGVSGVRLLEHMMRGRADAAQLPRLPWSPEPPPPARALLRAELGHRLHGVRELPHQLRAQSGLLPGLATVLRDGLTSAPDIGINPRHTGRDRLVVGTTMDLAAIKEVKNHFGVTVNDVVLAITARAMQRFLARRGVDIGRARWMRVMVPVSTHGDDHALSGSRVALLLIPLPLDERDPARLVTRVHAATAESKQRSTSQAGDLLTRTADVTAPSLLAGVLALSLARRGFNMIVTNVPGPPFPLYVPGGRMTSFHAIVNLWPGQGLGLALLSYCGVLHWAVHADRAIVPDAAGLPVDLQAAFVELREAARAGASSGAAQGAHVDAMPLDQPVGVGAR